MATASETRNQISPFNGFLFRLKDRREVMIPTTNTDLAEHIADQLAERNAHLFAAEIVDSWIWNLIDEHAQEQNRMWGF